jgi:diguanylate cyclase (GGDEF)-like protein
VAARLGGDEFVVLLRDCREPDARELIRSLVSKVAHARVVQGDQEASVSLSAGLLFVRPSDQPHKIETLLDAADKLMYKAKQAGGNQYQIRIV